jgi:uncharacterized protein YdeI (YjbR/CyaY-like superfamily)
LETLDVADVEGWRSWLRSNHLAKQEVWLVFHKGGLPSITYDEALDEALAYGWIDSVIKKLDGTRYARKFTSRRPGSIWSASNVDRVSRLRREGRMTKWGLGVFSKKSAETSMLDRFNSGQVPVPKDLEVALRRNRRAWANYQRMAPSHRKRYFIWVSDAKRPETREKRIAEAVLLIASNVKELLK